ncbi:MAG: hypothetical protein OQJ97_10235 [Rhodospirillales bacterium]|nr:hypothetical protein [Rhodospirillales bacterium]
MVNSISTQNTTLSLFQNKKDRYPQTDPLFAMLEKADPEKARSLKEKLSALNNTIKNLESSKITLDERLKKIAEEKIARIKAKLEALHMMVAMNPKAAAKQAAQLSKELAAAAREYASAGGGGGGLSVESSTNMTISSTPTDTNTAREGNTSTTPESTASQVAAVTTNTSALDAAKHDKNGELKAAFSPEAIKQKKEEEAKVFREKINEQITDANKTFAANKEDSEFANEVRRLKDALKNIIEEAKRRIKLNDGPSAGRDIKETEKALQATEQAVNSITAGISSALGAVNILA